MEDGDLDVLREGTCDYLGFSYYMTNAVKAEGGTGDAISGFEGSVPNPYVKASDCTLFSVDRFPAYVSLSMQTIRSSGCAFRI